MTEQEFLTFLTDNPYVVSYFTTPDCAVCSSLRPKIEAEIKKMDFFHFRVFDCTQEKWVCGQYLIFSVPTILIFDHGREVKRFSRFIAVQDIVDVLHRVKPS